MFEWWKKKLDDAYHRGYEKGNSHGYKRGYDSGCGEGYRKALLIKHDNVIHIGPLGMFICTTKSPDEQTTCVAAKGAK